MRILIVMLLVVFASCAVPEAVEENRVSATKSVAQMYKVGLRNIAHRHEADRQRCENVYERRMRGVAAKQDGKVSVAYVIALRKQREQDLAVLERLIAVERVQLAAHLRQYAKFDSVVAEFLDELIKTAESLKDVEAEWDAARAAWEKDDE